MTGCKIAEKDLINRVDDTNIMLEAFMEKEHNRQKALADNKVKNTGIYDVPSKKISGYIDNIETLIGKTITVLKDKDTNTIKIDKLSKIGRDVVEINDSTRVNLSKNRTLNNEKVIMGSDTINKDRNVERLETISGTVLAELDGLISKTMSMDSADLNAEHKDNLMYVFKTFRDTLLESGKDVDITVDMLKDLDNKETNGEAIPEEGIIKVINGNKRFNTATSILAHEMMHTLLNGVLKVNQSVHTDIIKLRDAMAEEFDYTVFLSKGESHTDEEIEYAKQRYEYVFNNTSKVKGVAAEEFLAAAVTDEQLIKALKLTPNPKQFNLISLSTRVNSKGKPDLLTKLWNIVATSINVTYRGLVLKGNSHNYALSLLDTAMKAKYKLGLEQDKPFYTKILEKVANADSKIAQYAEAGRKSNRSYSEYLRSQDESKLDKAMKAVWKIKGLARARSYALQNKLFGTVLIDMSDKSIAKFYQMFRHTKAFVDNMVVPITQSTIEVLAEDYKLKHLTEAQRSAVKRVLVDTDAKVLGRSKDIIEYLKDETAVDNRITELKSILKDKTTESNMADINKEVANTANLMVHNKALFPNVYVNATQMAADILNVSKGDLVDALDELITLEAISITSPNNKRIALEALTSTYMDKITKKRHNMSEGIDYSLDLLERQEKELIDKAYHGNLMYSVKGASQEEYKGDKTSYLVNAKEMKQLVKAGLSNVGKQEGLSKALGKDMYMVVGDSLEITYTEGLISKIQLTSEGDSLKRLLISQEGMDEEEAMLKIKSMKPDASLVPERNAIGLIYDYKIRVPYQDKVNLLGLNDDFIPTVGKTMSNFTHKQEAMLANKAAVQFFDQMHKANRLNKDYNFIEISPTSKGKSKEYWDSLPSYVKSYVKNESGGKLMIEESMLVDTFGYKDFSISTLPWIKNSKRRQLVMKNIEKIMFEIAKGWKDSIVVKTWDTVKGNAVSNAMVTTSYMKDKNVVRYLEQMQKNWAAMNDYKKLNSKKQKLELDVKAGRNVSKSVLRKLEVDMKNSSVYEIMQDGQYTAILEDIDTSWFDNQGILESKLNDLLSKGKIGKETSLKDVVDLMYIKKGSRFHDSWMKTTLYMDALNRIAIIEEFKKQAQELKISGKSNEEIGKELLEVSAEDIATLFRTGKSPQVWLDHVDSLFVNYNYLDNKFIKYANDTIVLSFTKYFFRVFGAMMKMAKNKAASVFLMETVNKGMGIGTDTPLTQFYNPYDSLLRKVGTAFNPIDNIEEIATPGVAKWFL